MSEAELCLKLESFFSDCEVYKEVPTNSGRCDIYLKRGPVWIAVEAKMQFSTTLIYQAMRNMPYAHYSYVAVPHLSQRSGIEICEKLGIGVLEYRYKNNHIEGWYHISEPSYRRNITPLRVLDRMKNAVAGVQHNSESDFKVSLSIIKLWIKRAGGRLAISTVFDNNKYHYSSTRSAAQCITRLCKQGKIKEFSIEGKEFVLNDAQ